MKHISESIIGRKGNTGVFQKTVNTIIVCPHDYDYTRIYKRFGIKNEHIDKNIYYVTTLDSTRIWLAPITDAIENDLCSLGPKKRFSSTSTTVIGTPLPVDQAISEIANTYEFGEILYKAKSMDSFEKISQETYIKLIK